NHLPRAVRRTIVHHQDTQGWNGQRIQRFKQLDDIAGFVVGRRDDRKIHAKRSSKKLTSTLYTREHKRRKQLTRHFWYHATMKYNSAAFMKHSKGGRCTGFPMAGTRRPSTAP